MPPVILSAAKDLSVPDDEVGHAMMDVGAGCAVGRR